MTALGNDYLEVSQPVRRLRGGSQPILAEASDGKYYVVKFANNLQGPNVLFNESAGTELYRACGLPVPSWKPLLLSDSFLDRNPGCWIQTDCESIRPQSGLCFGSRFLGLEGKQLLEILPGNNYKRVENRQWFWTAWLLDVCARHNDHRQAVFVEHYDRRLHTFFIDHGHLFGGPNGDRARKFSATRYLDPRIYPIVELKQLEEIEIVVRELNPDKLWMSLSSFPDEWKSSSAMNCLSESLDRLANSRLVRNLLEALVGSAASKYAIEEQPFPDGKN